MPDPIIADNAPKPVQLDAGQAHHRCACGRSQNQPFGDGSHIGTDFTPVAFTAGNRCEASRAHSNCSAGHARQRNSHWVVIRGARRRASLLGVVAAIAIAACSGGGEPNSDPTALLPPTTAGSAQPAGLELPEREGPRRETTGDVPHIQLDAEPDPTVDAELRRRALLLPGILDLPSDRSLPGARGLAFGDDVDLARPDVIDGSREFAHIHPDGSLHVWLPIDSAQEVDETKWGEIHPWADRDGFWPGVVMLYTPETLDELDVTLRILVDAYNFVTGASVTVAEIS